MCGASSSTTWRSQSCQAAIAAAGGPAAVADLDAINYLAEKALAFRVGPPALIEGRVGITSAVELRTVAGSAIERGPATYWFRVHAPLVDDEPITPLTRTLIAADFGNGISSVVSIESHVFINPDLTVWLHRLPEGEWVSNDAATWLEPGGAALADATLGDRTGLFGRAAQTLYVASR